MPSLRRAVVTVLAVVAGVVTVTDCDRPGGAPRVDTTTTTAASAALPAAPGPPVPSGWDPHAGPVLLVAGERPDAAIIVFPELQGDYVSRELGLRVGTLRGSTVTLMTRAGEGVTATLGDSTAPGEEEHCVGWPMLRIVPTTGAVASWAVGFIDARVAPIALDSVGSLSLTDSATLVAEVARLASTIPVRPAAARMRGLPFSVRDVLRFRMSSGPDVLVAQVVRRVHQEANPIEERTLLIAERDTAQQQRSGRYTLAFHQRAVGPEETLEGIDVVAGFATESNPHPLLVIARESEGGVRYALLERIGPRNWRVKWTSALVRC